MKKIVNFMGIALCGVALMFSSCSKDDATTDPNAGKVDPSTIASANLVAYFPFESATASISKGDGITFGKTSGAASFAVGRRGNAYKGSTSAAYLEYNVTSSANAFKSLTEFTMSAWIKSPAAAGAAKIITINGGDSFMGHWSFMLEGNSNADSLDLKGYLYNANPNNPWKGQDLRDQDKAYLSDKWVHIVYSYNKATSTMSLYANGKLITSAVKYSDAAPATGAQPLLGALTFGADITKLHIGAWTQQIAGTPESWMAYYPGMLDELRLYNKALTDAEVLALYNAELTQIN